MKFPRYDFQLITVSPIFLYFTFVPQNFYPCLQYWTDTWVLNLEFSKISFVIPVSPPSFVHLCHKLFSLPPILNGYLGVEFTREDVDQLWALEQFFWWYRLHVFELFAFIFCSNICIAICCCRRKYLYFVFTMYLLFVFVFWSYLKAHIYIFFVFWSYVKAHIGICILILIFRQSSHWYLYLFFDLTLKLTLVNQSWSPTVTWNP